MTETAHENPLAEGLSLRKTPDPCALVIFGASGDLAHKKLMPALYALAVREKKKLNPIAVIYWAVRDDERYGWGRIPGTDIEFTPMPENWTGEARARTIERLSGFLAGNVQAQPEEVERCRWCDFVSACRVEQQTLVMIEGGRAG